MKQAVMTEPGKIQMHDIKIPCISDNQVLIKIKRIGVCGSDIHVNHGKHPYTSYPIVQGHEVSGEIAQVGSRVNNLSIGDMVTIQPQVTCGVCYPCKHGQYHICDSLKVMGFQTNGCAQEYFAVDAEKVLKIPEGLSLDEGALIEPIAVAVHAVSRGGDVKGKKVLVFGGGTIGNLVAQVAKAKGAEKVIVTDLNDYKIKKANDCGIENAVNTTNTEINSYVLEHFGQDKADLILECVGVNQTMEQAVNIARKGTNIVVVGVFGEKATVDLGLVQDRELCLIGTLMYQEKDYIEAMELMKSDKMFLKPLLTKYFNFDDYMKAYEYIDNSKGNYMKVMIKIDE